MTINTLDKKILNRLQKDIPFASDPWAIIAKEIGVSEEKLLERVRGLKKKGMIRRISATFDPRKAGYKSTLAAAKVNNSELNNAARKISEYDEVTHNYKREAEYNLWFTLVAPNKSKIVSVLGEIKKINGVAEVLNLPAERIYKIGVNFKV